MLDYLTEVITPAMEAKASGGEAKVLVGLMAAFMAGAEVGVMKWWIENGMQFFLSAFGLKWALGREGETE